jgi:hypothetical protein
MATNAVLIPPISDSVLWGNARPKKLTFQHLPMEMKLLIYRHALVEPLRWTKAHRVDCIETPKPYRFFADPPFWQTKIYVTPAPWPLRTTTPCDCAKRKALNFLLASKAVNAVASPIFWGENTFCFIDAADVTATIGARLRPACRDQIRSISVMTDKPSGNRHRVDGCFYRGSRRMLFLDTVMQCKRLESLDMPAAYMLPCCADRMAKLSETMPALKSVRLNYLTEYRTTEPLFRFDSPSSNKTQWYQQSIYVRCSRLLPLKEQQWSPERMTELTRELDTNFRVQVNTVVKTRFLGVPLNQLQRYKICIGNLPPDLYEPSRTRRVTLPTGEVVKVEFYGLPMDPQQKIRAHRQRMAIDRKQIMATGKTVAQHQVEEEARQRRKQHRESKAQQETEKLNQALAERRLRRLELTDAKREKTKEEMKQVRKAVKARDEDRKAERKRTTRRPS